MTTELGFKRTKNTLKYVVGMLTVKSWWIFLLGDVATGKDSFNRCILCLGKFRYELQLPELKLQSKRRGRPLHSSTASQEPQWSPRKAGLPRSAGRRHPTLPTWIAGTTQEPPQHARSEDAAAASSGAASEQPNANGGGKSGPLINKAGKYIIATGTRCNPEGGTQPQTATYKITQE